MFITFDGGDGGGKSTQLELLRVYLTERFGESQVVTCRDPGSTQLGDEVRKVLLHRAECRIDDVTEMLLFMAARAQLVREVIQPALSENKIVLCDRFVLSTQVYQGCAGGISLAEIDCVARVAVGNTLPDLGFVFHLPFAIGRARIAARAAFDRMEAKGDEYHQRVSDGFITLAKRDSSRYLIIDAARSIAEISAEIRQRVQEKLGS